MIRRSWERGTVDPPSSLNSIVRYERLVKAAYGVRGVGELLTFRPATWDDFFVQNLQINRRSLAMTSSSQARLCIPARPLSSRETLSISDEQGEGNDAQDNL
jgi:hypothetical protein